MFRLDECTEARDVEQDLQREPSPTKGDRLRSFTVTGEHPPVEVL